MNAYKYFFTVMKEQSVNKAAEKMGVSQPTVSYNIHALQRELGEQLFIVDRNGIAPTPRALVLYRRLKPTYSALLRVINDFIQKQNELIEETR